MNKEQEKQFDKATWKTNNDGNPYFPDWDKVKTFISQIKAETRQEIIKDMDKLSIKDFNKKWNCNIK
uniref:Uncharacterized protein n=1 Tax=viral metagenome TaxID=1070528 RepID=A0A6H1ZF40_9ZZZZ